MHGGFNDMVRPLLSVIIVSFNTKKLTTQAITSLFSASKKRHDIPLEIIVIDNNSSDGTVAALKKDFGSLIHIIANADNKGFAGANNQGFHQAKGEFFLLLNSDTIVDESLFVLVDALKSDKTLGIVSGKLLNSDGSYQPQGGQLPTLLTITAWWLWPLPGKLPGIGAYQDTSSLTGSIVERGWVGGTAMLVRRSLYESIGGLDEGIFMYGEDVEYCYRAHLAGYGVALLPSSQILHYQSASSGKENALLGEIHGLLYIFAKHHSPLSLSILRLILVWGSLSRYLLFGILEHNSAKSKLYMKVLHATLK